MASVPEKTRRENSYLPIWTAKKLAEIQTNTGVRLYGELSPGQIKEIDAANNTTQGTK